MMRAGREDWAAEMLSDLQAYAGQALPAARSVWAEVTLPAARGLVAHAKGDWATAVTELESVRDRFDWLGGSHAQRDLFEQIYLDSLIRVEEDSKALKLLSLRAISRRNISAIQQQINQIQQKLAIR
jgi:hypothetical protein